MQREDGSRYLLCDCGWRRAMPRLVEEQLRAEFWGGKAKRL
jgi:hypothetical protein